MEGGGAGEREGEGRRGGEERTGGGESARGTSQTKINTCTINVGMVLALVISAELCACRTVGIRVTFQALYCSVFGVVEQS